jgi:N-acetyl sugar amidotransferase
MKKCKRCFYNENHALNIVFDDEGVCSGCKIHEEKDIIDWSEKSIELEKILNEFKNTSGNNYDCIIPVSGGGDSYFIVDVIKNKYKMNPLLVTYNKQFNTETGVDNLANLRIKFDCDILTLTINPEIVKKITRATLRKLGSMYWHCIAGQTVFPVQIAVRFKIPLIIWGAHQGIDQVGMFSHHDRVEMTRKYRREHDLMGLEAEDLIDEFDGITELDVMQYKYPNDKEIEMVGVRGIYLNNYIRWDSLSQHKIMEQKFGFKPAKQNRTFDYYNNVDCFNYNDIHDYIKFIKHGYSKVVDHACRELRLNKISREEGLELIKNHIYRKPENLNIFLKWIGMTENSFYYIIDQHRNLKFWERDENWNWCLKDGSYKEKEEEKINKNNEKYILIGKGYNN